MDVPVTFALDLPAHGTAVAQRKQLLVLPLWGGSQSAVSYRAAAEIGAASRLTVAGVGLTLFLGLMLKKMFGRRVSGPMEQ